jgi:hypothetical protein
LIAALRSCSLRSTATMRAPRSAKSLDGRGSDDAGSAGDDGDPAIQANSIGHEAFPLARPVIPDFLFSRGGRANFHRATISSDADADQRPGSEDKPPFPRRIRRVNRWHASGG